MNVYFVRHGESELNAKGYHQHGLTPLSNLGIQQAKILAKRFETIPVDLIIASPFIRARQTAEAISKVKKTEIIFTDLLREKKFPTEIEEKPFEDPIALEIKKVIKENINDRQWHYSDEENIFDIHIRAIEFLNYFEKFEDENIVIVSHGTFLRMLLATILFKESVTPKLFLRIEYTFHTSNTGISMWEKDTQGRWYLLTWNDFAHLGNLDPQSYLYRSGKE